MSNTLSKLPLPGLALSFILTLIASFVRSDNALLSTFEDHRVTFFFVIALIAGALIACVLFLLLKSERRMTLLGLGSIALSALSFLSVTLVANDLLYPLAGALLSGFVLGLITLFYLGQLLALLTVLSPDRIVLNLSAGLLGAAILLYAISFLPTTHWVCCCLFLCSGIGIAGFLVFKKKPQMLAASHNSETLSFPPVSNKSVGQLVLIGWGGIGALVFNLFTLGLTFWPESAGVEGGLASTSKITTYVLILIVVLVITRSARKKGDTFVLVLFYRIALPVAIAIALASPFLENIQAIENGYLLGVFNYLGIALLNMLGLMLVVWLGALSPKSFAQVFSLMVLGCCLALGAGMVVFGLLGKQAQIVSLCVLAIFLVALIITTLLRNAGEQQLLGLPHKNATVAIAEQLAAEYALSPREEEILAYLARGRGSKYIADELCISPETVRTHCKRIYDKMGVHSREEVLDLIELHSPEA